MGFGKGKRPSFLEIQKDYKGGWDHETKLKVLWGSPGSGFLLVDHFRERGRKKSWCQPPPKPSITAKGWRESRGRECCTSLSGIVQN